MISVSVDLSKIDKARLFRSTKSGRLYLNLVLLDQTDSYGNLIAIQPVGKEEYAKGKRGEQVGRWKELRAKATAPPAAKHPTASAGDGLFDTPEAAYHANQAQLKGQLR